MGGGLERVRNRALRLIASVLERVGARAAAIEALWSLAGLDPSDQSSARRLADLLLAAGDETRYRDLLERQAEAHPGDASVAARLGRHLHRIGDYQRALPLFVRLAALRPDDVQALTTLGEIHLKLNQPAPARDCFLRVLGIAKDRNALRWLFKIGQLFLIHEQPGEALSTYRGILDAMPGEGTAQLALSRLTYQGGDLDEALRLVSRLGSAAAASGSAAPPPAAPPSAPAGPGGSAGEGLEDRVRRAIRMRDAALDELILEGRAAEAPAAISIPLPDGVIQAMVPDRFRQALKPVYSIEEQRAVRRRLIGAYLRDGLVDRALFHLGQYRPAGGRETTWAQAQRGLALFRRGEGEAAQRELDRLDLSALASRAPADLELVYQVAVTYLHLGRPPRALEALKRVLVHDIGFRDAAALADRLRAVHTSTGERIPDADRTRVLASPGAPGGRSGASGASPGEPAAASGAARAASAAAEAARLLGAYEIAEPLHRGFAGELYAGRDPRLDRRLVLRRLPPAVVADATVRARFIEAARLASRLDHPHVVSVLDVLEPASGEVWFVTPWVPGCDAARLVRTGRPLAPALAARLAQQAAAALECAHAAGILHRDLKSSDFHVDLPSRTLRLLDLGLEGVSNTMEVAPAEYLDRRSHFMPPEFILGERVDERGDIYSLGMFLFLIVTGHYPFDDVNVHARLHRYLKQPVPRPDDLVPGAGRTLSDLISSCLARDRRERPASAAQLAAGLERIAATATEGP
jgi:tetratricopeptide (TPR) repeat protein